MNLIFAFLAIIIGTLEGAWKATEKAYEDFGGIPTSCAVIALAGIFFNIVDKNDPSWELIAVPFGIYALATAVKAISGRIYDV